MLHTLCTQRAGRLVDWIWNEENEIKHKVLSGTQSIGTDSDAVGDDDEEEEEEEKEEDKEE